ncbi:MAG: 16S rRNA (uracil(1498)-N(3))-methyltransferase [Burkholderiaceae bacterium]
MGGAPRFFVEVAGGLRVGATVELPEAVAHHAQHALRLRDGAAIVLVDGRGGEYAARLAAGRRAAAEVLAFDPVERESPLAVTLIQAFVPNEKLDWIIEKSTELGVARIVLAPATRSVARLDAQRLARKRAHWREVAIAACCQCGRNRVPEVLDAPSFAGALALAQTCEARVLLAPGAGAALVRHARARSIAVAIGPEGGFCAQEIALAQRAGFVVTALGPRVLRTETAGPAALAALQAVGGDLSAA